MCGGGAVVYAFVMCCCLSFVGCGVVVCLGLCCCVGFVLLRVCCDVCVLLLC